MITGCAYCGADPPEHLEGCTRPIEVTMTTLGEAMKCEPARHERNGAPSIHVLRAEDVETLRTVATGGIACCEVCGEWVFVPPAYDVDEINVYGLPLNMRMELK